MLRRAFLRRMVFAGLATWFLDLPLPREASAESGPIGYQVQYRMSASEAWSDYGDPIVFQPGEPASLDLTGMKSGASWRVRWRQA